MRIPVFLACLSLALAFAPGRLRPIRYNRNLIVGGDEVTVGSRPYQAALFSRSSGGFQSQYCAGTLVHREWVVSAAHCAGGTVYVGLGYHRLDDTGLEIIRGTWTVHSGYNSNTLDNDISLIKLSSPASLSSLVEPISIASSGSDVSAGTDLLVSGWGSLASGGSYPYELRQVVVPTVSRSSCSSAYSPSATITSNMICAGESGKDSCQGDSGGPIVSNFNVNSHTSSVTLEGIVSWGFGCADPDYPGVYTRVANYCSWIASQTSNAVTC